MEKKPSHEDPTKPRVESFYASQSSRPRNSQSEVLPSPFIPAFDDQATQTRPHPNRGKGFQPRNEEDQEQLPLPVEVTSPTWPASRPKLQIAIPDGYLSPLPHRTRSRPQTPYSRPSARRWRLSATLLILSAAVILGLPLARPRPPPRLSPDFITLHATHEALIKLLPETGTRSFFTQQLKTRASEVHASIVAPAQLSRPALDEEKAQLACRAAAKAVGDFNLGVYTAGRTLGQLGLAAVSAATLEQGLVSRWWRGNARAQALADYAWLVGREVEGLRTEGEVALRSLAELDAALAGLKSSAGRRSWERRAWLEWNLEEDVLLWAQASSTLAAQTITNATRLLEAPGGLEAADEPWDMGLELERMRVSSMRLAGLAERERERFKQGPPGL